jgi:hypothetical protein
MLGMGKIVLHSMRFNYALWQAQAVANPQWLQIQSRRCARQMRHQELAP